MAVKGETLTILLRILEERQTSQEDFDSSLRKISDQYKEIEGRIESFQSNDLAVSNVKNKATTILKSGDLEGAERFIIKNNNAEIQCGETLLGSIESVGESNSITFNPTFTT